MKRRESSTSTAWSSRPRGALACGLDIVNALARGVGWVGRGGCPWSAARWLWAAQCRSLPGDRLRHASAIDTDLLGHGYFAENKELIDDIFLILRHGFPAPDRNLTRIPDGVLFYYRLR